jgi:peptidoglycan/LPS O-acetylase OafA/YrhL
MNAKHRKEVDGLRAVAVLPVIFFHAGFGSGGYVGVDVFFVISGFLITQILIREIDNGTFSLVAFYERRARRILPALLATLAVSFVLAAALLIPTALVDFAKSALATLGFASNVYFWRFISYFTGSGDLSPLLHTWSLAVEEQFYIFFPLLLWVVPRRLRPAVLWLVVLSSFVVSAWLLPRRPSATFFLLPTRAWELGVGSLLATHEGRVRRMPGKEIASGLGLLLIAVAVGWFTARSPFPGPRALLPCIGAALVIAGGGETVGGRFLSWRPLQWFGLISYSLYLWHWPWLVFTKQALIDPNPAWWIRVGCLLGSIATAWLSWRYVERPFRERDRVSRRQIFTASAAVIVGLALVAGVFWRGSGWPWRLSPARLEFESAHYPTAGQRCLNMDVASAWSQCTFGVPGATPSTILWGDSHAGSLTFAIDESAKAAGRSGVLLSFNGCPPLGGATVARLAGSDRQTCDARNQEIAARIEHDPRIDTVVLMAFWSSYRAEAADFDTELANRVDGLVRLGRRVVVLTDVPEPGYDVRWALARGAVPRPAKLPAPLPVPAAATQVSLASALCRDGLCDVVGEGHSLFHDGNHLSEYAVATRVAPYLVGRIWR